MPAFANLPQHIYFFAAVLVVLLVAFLLYFCIPALRLSHHLKKAIGRLSARQRKAGDDVGLAFEKTGVLEPLWREYQSTFHEQAEAGSGQAATVRQRATLPASFVFRSGIIVDTTLHADFFKHLPGLFTGIGIIGTFYGLLLGLQSFQVSENPIIVRNSLTTLLHGVSEAFLVSAAAITLAMVITFIEKLTIARLNAKVEKLAQLLDGLFEGGTSEEYLARLVKAAEASAGQTAQLLEGGLRVLFADLAEKQIAAANANAASLGDRVVASLERSLAVPLGDIATALKGVRSDQDAAMQAMLSNALTLFGQQLKDIFGGQVAGINSVQQQTIEALQAAVATLQTMAANVEAAGRNTAASMAEQLSDSIAGAEARQRVMNEKMAEFVDQMRQAMSGVQGETQSHLRTALAEMTAGMSDFVGRLEQQARLAAEASGRRQDELAASSSDVIVQFGGRVDALLEGVNRAAAEMKGAATAMRSTAGEAMVRLNSGADTLYLAAKDFAKAGQGVTATLEKSTIVAAQLNQAAGSVAAASLSLSGILADYKAARDAVASLVASLQGILEQARREASMSGDVFSRIEGATTRLVEAQREADGYLARVSAVIGEAHESFADGMTKAVGEANRDFHQALSDSVKLLREGIQELEDTLGTASGTG